jgi:hypothetical protein
MAIGSSLTRVRAALEQRLQALPGGWLTQTAFENAVFLPKANVAFQRINFIMSPPDNPTIGDGFYRERGIFQITLCAPINTGAGDTLYYAERIRDWFPRGASFVNEGITARVETTPQIGPGSYDGDRFNVPISIRFWADIYPS